MAGTAANAMHTIATAALAHRAMPHCNISRWGLTPGLDRAKLSPSPSPTAREGFMHCSLRRILISLLVLAATAWAQTGTGNIQGTVKDASGAVLPGARVSITHTQTSRQYTTTSTELGFY